MNTLILMRHAKAVRPWGAMDDRDRGLTDGGRAEAAATARALLANGLAPTMALVSPAARAVQTWEAVHAVLGETPMRSIEALYMASPDELEAQAAQAGAAVTLVIAHNPGLKELARWYAGDDGDHNADGLAHLDDGFQTGCAAVFTMSGAPARGRAVLQAFIRPADAPPNDEHPGEGPSPHNKDNPKDDDDSHFQL